MDPNLAKVWHNQQIPVIAVAAKTLLIRMPFALDNKAFLRKVGGKRANKATWDARQKCWKAPKSWLERAFKHFLKRYGSLYLVQKHLEREVCAPACWNAKSHACTCSCMGKNHGKGEPGNGWYVISDACAVRLGEGHLHYTLYTATSTL